MKKIATLTITATLLLGACSGSSEDGAATTTTAADSATTEATGEATTSADAPTTTEAEAPSLEDAVRAYTDAFLGGEDEAAYALLSERCHGEMASADFKDIVDQAEATYGGETITTYDENVNGNTATVTYELTDPVLNQTNERWVLENGAWLNDEC
ncbi:MAG TPA: hypothetical protein VNS19_23040 [Acidimicrobiales bacterium]|nr:hypothetical protein [Acidimicrobiales bacterium]